MSTTSLYVCCVVSVSFSFHRRVWFALITSKMWTHASLLVALRLSVAAALKPLPVPDVQIPLGDKFVGAPAAGNELLPKIQFQPPSSLMHGDSANTGSTDSPGPLGNDPEVTSALQILGVMLWGPNGTLSGGRADISNPASPRIGLGAYDPTTLENLAEWYPDDPDEYLNLGYMEQRLEDSSLLISGLSGRLYVVQRQDTDDGKTTLTQTREVSLNSTLSTGETLLNSLFDTEGNIWFTSGTLSGTPLGPQSSTTVGYVEPNGRIHTLHIPDQQVENGIAVNGTTAYVVTGPLNSTDTVPKTGYVWALTTDPSEDEDRVATVWKAEYDSGTRQKPGGLTRGGGTTPALLGDEYVVTTDNADGRVNLLVVRQAAAAQGVDQVACKVPLFEEGASSVDIRPTVHFDGSSYGVVIINTYNMQPIEQQKDLLLDFNGAWNNMTSMPGGIVRVDVSSSASAGKRGEGEGEGVSCEVRWESDIRTKSVPALSTKTGLLYGSLQDEDLAVKGQYNWYIAAIDWDSGELVWKRRTGAGGTYNDNQYPGTVGLGRFYQSLMLGVVYVEDGSSET